MKTLVSHPALKRKLIDHFEGAVAGVLASPAVALLSYLIASNLVGPGFIQNAATAGGTLLGANHVRNIFSRGSRYQKAVAAGALPDQMQLMRRDRTLTDRGVEFFIKGSMGVGTALLSSVGLYISGVESPIALAVPLIVVPTVGLIQFDDLVASGNALYKASHGAAPGPSA